jgi:hypothetical protein
MMEHYMRTPGRRHEIKWLGKPSQPKQTFNLIQDLN